VHSFNPDAAPADEKTELLLSGPWCFADDAGRVALSCSGRAQRTQRAGIHELNYWRRRDRTFCESKFFRSRVVPDPPGFTTAETCRTELAVRNTTCYQECDVCKAYCASSLARGIKDTYECTFGQPHLGIQVANSISDAGQHINVGHGSNRPKGVSAIPEDAFKETFQLLVNNNVEVPRVPRSSISCRKDHRESTFGHYRPHLDDAGKPILRTGFMVGCMTDSDCHSRCGEHPIHNQPYVCTKHPRFYSIFNLSADNPEGDFVSLPGDERFDVENHTQGVCTDIRYDFQKVGCESRTGSAVILGLGGCTSALGAVRAYCGAVVERSGPDFLDVAISEASLEYPRTLVAEEVYNGIEVQKVECEDETACVNKCEIMNRGARAGGLPAPEACAMCETGEHSLEEKAGPHTPRTPHDFDSRTQQFAPRILEVPSWTPSRP
jgi:hypothetical protein